MIKSLKAYRLVIFAAIVLAGCGSDDDSSAGLAGGIYAGSMEELDDFSISAAVLPEENTWGVTLENGQTVFGWRYDNGYSYVYFGNANAAEVAPPEVSGEVVTNVTGNFDRIYELDLDSSAGARGRGEYYELGGFATFAQGEIRRSSEYCYEESGDFGTPISSLSAFVEVPENDEPSISEKSICGELEEFYEGGNKVYINGINADADIVTYEAETGIDRLLLPDWWFREVRTIEGAGGITDYFNYDDLEGRIEFDEERQLFVTTEYPFDDFPGDTDCIMEFTVSETASVPVNPLRVSGVEICELENDAVSTQPVSGVIWFTDYPQFYHFVMAIEVGTGDERFMRWWQYVSD